MLRVLIIGGYGNFGSFIASKLAGDSNIKLIIAGRDAKKAYELAKKLKAKNKVEYVPIDIHQNFYESLTLIKPGLTIHTSGPFQGQGYDVAKACLEYGCHYVDLADARDFVSGITVLDEPAKQRNILICTGASSVPALSSAIIERYVGQFKTLESVEYAISTAQRANRGLATTQAVLSYAGKAFKTLIGGSQKTIHGWTDIYSHNFWQIGTRWLGSCDIPDLDIFPKRYPTLKNIRFRAGLELKFLQFMLSLSAWLVRLGLISSLAPASQTLLKISNLFNFMGTYDSGFYMTLSGKDRSGNTKTITFDIVAKGGDGLFIPSIPSIIIAKKIAAGHQYAAGATPCIDLISLDEYLRELQKLRIEWSIS